METCKESYTDFSFPASSQKQSREVGHNISDVVNLSKHVQLYGLLHEGEAPEVCNHQFSKLTGLNIT